MSARRGSPGRSPESAVFHRRAAFLTERSVLHRSEKEALVRAAPLHRRRRVRADLEASWRAEEVLAAADAEQVVGLLRDCASRLSAALERLAALRLREALGKVETELQRLRTVTSQLDTASEAAALLDLGAAGAATENAERELWLVGTGLVGVLNQLLADAAVAAELRARLEENVRTRRAAKRDLEELRKQNVPVPRWLQAAAAVHQATAEAYLLAAEALAAQPSPSRADAAPRRVRLGREGELLVVSPLHCETFLDVGGLADVKEQLRGSIGAIVERPGAAARYGVLHNGILFYGPPGTGKTLLSRAIAGEYGLRYIRFSPAVIASAFVHEAAANLRRLFELARDNAPCVLFLDEIDAIATDRADQPSADHRELVTQLMICLEEFRSVPGLVIAAATNAIDRLDPGLREGRFDTRIAVRAPDAPSRAEVLRVHLERRRDAVEWDDVDLDALARMTAGSNGAALEVVVTTAAQQALREDRRITQDDLVRAVRERRGVERADLDTHLAWNDVVITDEARAQLNEVLTVFTHPELAQELGVRPPAGVLLCGPPGTGKTTLAKAIAAETAASFYEVSAADMMSKWVGESEQRVVRLFERARAHRPSIIFVDEIDAVLKRRIANSQQPWEERVVAQFLQELDGMHGGDGVLLLGATSRLDVLDEAVVGRRLIPVEIGMPDLVMRLRLLELLCRDVKLAADVNLRTLATATAGMSGADLQRLRDGAGMKALGRATRAPRDAGAAPGITMADFHAALDSQRGRVSLAVI